MKWAIRLGFFVLMFGIALPVSATEKTTSEAGISFYQENNQGKHVPMEKVTITENSTEKPMAMEETLFPKTNENTCWLLIILGVCLIMIAEMLYHMKKRISKAGGKKMAKSKKIVLSVFTLIVLLWLSPKVAAAPRPLTDLGYFRWANQITTPADNTFIMHYGEHTSVEPIEGKVTGKIVTVDWSTSKSSALIKNVGFYKGQEVNLKVTLERNKSNLDGGSVFFTEGNFLSIDISGEMIITYDFLDTSGNPLTIETSFNYYGLNVNKYVGYRNPSRVIKYLCTNNPTNIVYDVYGDGNRQWGDYWGYYKNITPNVPWRDPRQSFEVITNPVSQLHVVVHNNDSTPSSVIYRTDFLAKPEFPSAYATDSFFEKADQDVCLKAKQTIPNISQWKKANQLQVRFGLEQIAKTQQYKAKKVKVTNFSGEDITELFSSKVEGQEMVITAKNPEDHRLYDTVLQYEVELE